MKNTALLLVAIVFKNVEIVRISIRLELCLEMIMLLR